MISLFENSLCRFIGKTVSEIIGQFGINRGAYITQETAIL